MFDIGLQPERVSHQTIYLVHQGKNSGVTAQVDVVSTLPYLGS